jgi:hypothetical protein
LGEFSPIRRLFIFGQFLKITEAALIIWDTFSHSKIMQ